MNGCSKRPAHIGGAFTASGRAQCVPCRSMAAVKVILDMRKLQSCIAFNMNNKLLRYARGIGPATQLAVPPPRRPWLVEAVFHR